MTVEPFQIDVPDAAIADLRDRLARTRWPAPVPGSDWEDGTDAAYLRDLVRYWRDQYDWRARERVLNGLPHFRARIGGTDIHFIHARGEGRRRIPLLLMHGWPSSFVQMTDIIPLLTRADDRGYAFDVVLPSMPGYPFSGVPDEPGTGFPRIAELMTALMVDILGYDRFAARGSDQGGLVQQQIGLVRPDRLIGLHRSGISPYASPMPVDLSADERAYQAEVAGWVGREQTYAQLQRLRPETLTPALADSPVGWASWVIEKFQRWGDCGADGAPDVDGWFGRDRLLDNISLHWFAGTSAASVRLYREWARDPGRDGRIDVPTAFMMPRKDRAMVPAPREWAERFYDVRRWTVTERGGHFPEWETPRMVADDVRAFFVERVEEGHGATV